MYLYVHDVQLLDMPGHGQSVSEWGTSCSFAGGEELELQIFIGRTLAASCSSKGRSRRRLERVVAVTRGSLVRDFHEMKATA